MCSSDLENDDIDVQQQAAIELLFLRRRKGEPVAYLTGEREFYGLSLQVTPAVLIPRPETELLVELALERLNEAPTEHPGVLDLGTGSGAIAIAIAIKSQHNDSQRSSPHLCGTLTATCPLESRHPATGNAAWRTPPRLSRWSR